MKHYILGFEYCACVDDDVKTAKQVYHQIRSLLRQAFCIFPCFSVMNAGFTVAIIQGWEREGYLAVQWRTETSTGNLTRCYGHVRDRIEEYRTREVFKRGQVFFNTDLPQHVSTTYSKVCLRTLKGSEDIVVHQPALFLLKMEQVVKGGNCLKRRELRWILLPQVAMVHPLQCREHSPAEYKNAKLLGGNHTFPCTALSSQAAICRGETHRYSRARLRGGPCALSVEELQNFNQFTEFEFTEFRR